MAAFTKWCWSRSSLYTSNISRKDAKSKKDIPDIEIPGMLYKL